MFSDLRYVLRSLTRAKGFTLVTAVTLALGIGSAAAIFSVVDYVLFCSRSFPDDLVLLGAKTKQSEFFPMVFAAQATVYRTLESVFDDTALAKYEMVNVVVRGEPVANSVMMVSPNFFSLLGIKPAEGRGFLPSEEVEGRNASVVITDDFRREVFPDEDDAIGRKLLVDQTVCTVVGVLAPHQAFPVYGYGRVFRPFGLRDDPTAAWQTNLLMYARLKPHVTPAVAEQAMSAVRLEAPARLRDYLGNLQRRAATMDEAAAVMRRENYWVLLGAVGFLYAIACLNATNLMVVRLLGRRRELSIRLALGASRSRLIRLLLMEGVSLALLAGLAGVLVANWLLPLLMAVAQSRQSFTWSRWALDWRVMSVLLGLTLLTALLITIVPAWRIARADVQAGLKEGGAALGETRALARVRGGFVALQAAFALILLAGAGLMVSSINRLQAVPLGFEVNNRMKVRLQFPTGHVAAPEARHALLKRLQEHLTRIPGVRSASYGTDTLLAGYYYAPVTLVLRDGQQIQAKVDHVAANFFETTGMKLLRGRMVAERGGEVLINETLARRYFGDEDPIGKPISKTKDAGSGAGDWQVVGLVNDVRHQAREAAGYRIYAPESWWPPNMDTFILQVEREPDRLLASAVKRAIYDLDPKIVVNQAASLGELRGYDQGIATYVTSVLKVVSGIALILATVGLFSILAYTVDRRMGEFGIRLALGATSRDLIALVLQRGVLLALTGVLCGLAGALALTRYLQSLLYDTPAYDPRVFAVVTMLLLSAAVLACVLPARRATKIDVAKLLRSE